MKHLFFSILFFVGLSVFSQNSGEELYSAKKYKEASIAYKQELKKMPENYKLQLGYANSLHKQELFKKAVEQYNIAEKLDNSDSELFFNRGAALVFLELYKKALKDFDKSIELNANKAEVYYFKGYCNYELARYKASIEAYSKAIEIRPKYAEAMYNRGAAKAELKDFESGAKDFELALASDPNLENGRINIALSKLAQEQYEEAIKDFDIIIEKRGKNLAKAYFYRGEAYYELKNKEKACDDWLKASNLGNENGSSNIEDFCGSETKPRKKIDIVF